MPDRGTGHGADVKDEGSTLPDWVASAGLRSTSVNSKFCQAYNVWTIVQDDGIDVEEGCTFSEYRCCPRIDGMDAAWFVRRRVLYAVK